MRGHFIIYLESNGLVLEVTPVDPYPLPAGKKAVCWLENQGKYPGYGENYTTGAGGTETRTPSERREAEYQLRLDPKENKLKGQIRDGDQNKIDALDAEIVALRSQIRLDIPLT